MCAFTKMHNWLREEESSTVHLTLKQSGETAVWPGGMHALHWMLYPKLSSVFLGVQRERKLCVSSWNNNQNGWQQPQSPLSVPGTDPSIPAVVFTCFTEELITSCVDSCLVYGHILVPMGSFNKHLYSTTQPYVHSLPEPVGYSCRGRITERVCCVQHQGPWTRTCLWNEC